MVQLVRQIPNISFTFDAGKFTNIFLVLANTNAILQVSAMFVSGVNASGSDEYGG